VTVERVPVLAERARAILAELGYDNVEVIEGDGSKGAPEFAPFGGISMTATADAGFPQALREQFGQGAALVGPVRRPSGEYLFRWREGIEEVIAPVRFVPLIEGDKA
jgi:protein-L-isoaspartate(D-aspartate) O-methyltransferase